MFLNVGFSLSLSSYIVISFILTFLAVVLRVNCSYFTLLNCTRKYLYISRISTVYLYLLLLNLTMLKLAQLQNEFNFTKNNIEMNFKLPFANGKLHIFPWELQDAIQKDLRTYLESRKFYLCNGKQNITKCLCNFPFTTTFVTIYWQKKKYLKCWFMMSISKILNFTKLYFMLDSVLIHVSFETSVANFVNMK